MTEPFEERAEPVPHDLAGSEPAEPDKTRRKVGMAVAAALVLVTAIAAFSAFDDGAPTNIEFSTDPDGNEPLYFTIDHRDLTDAPLDTSVRVALADAKSRWVEAGIGSYRLEVTERLNYWSKGCKWTTILTDGEVAGAPVDPSSDSPNCREIEWTVELLHDRIVRFADSVEQYSDPVFGEHTLDVAFGEFGVPETIVFDLANGYDEEASLLVKFTTLTTPQPSDGP